jgi:putative redox protein
MKSERLTFENAQGQKLVARLDRPDSFDAGPFALFAHCFTCTKNFKAVANISKALTAKGVGVFRFDFTGLGESEGDFSYTNFSSNTEDLIAAAQFLEREHSAPNILIGHSLGGAAVLQAAHSIPSASAVATIAAPCEPNHLKKLLNLSAEEMETKGEAEIVIAGRQFTIRKQFIDDLDETNMKKTIHDLGKALIIFHSPFDRIVGIDNAAYIFQTARHPKSFISLNRADHLLSDESDSRYVGNLIAVWSDRYLS